MEERYATVNDQWKSELMDHTHGRGTVPTIVWDDGRRQVGFRPGRG